MSKNNETEAKLYAKQKRNWKRIRKVSFLFSVLFSFGLVMPFVTDAAELFFEAPAELRPGAEFVVAVFVESDNPVNAFSASIIYPARILDFQAADTANSIINFWARRPAQQEPGLIAFEGGIIGEPFRGRGKLVALRFTAKAEGRAAIGFLESQVLLADGRGTPAAISQNEIEIVVTADAPIARVAPTQDTVPPEITLAEIIKSPVDNAPILIFQIAERESGLAGSFARFRKWFSWDAWQEAENQIGVPYGAWQMQIRAVDNFGNEAIRTLTRQNTLIEKMVAGGFVALLAITIGVLAALRKLRRKSGGDTARDTKTQLG